MRKLVVANWKMNPVRLRDAEKLFDEIAKTQKTTRGVEVIICPPSVYLSSLEPSKGQRVGVGAQNCFWEERGPYTGEVSPKTLRDLGCRYVIIGHSERRKWAKETDTMINKKLLAAAATGLRVIFCVGEKEGENINSVLRKQLTKGLRRFPLQKLRLLNIAYEPVWAIGTGRPCKPDNALVAKMLTRRILTGMFKKRALAEKVRILYGGSVNSKISQSYITEGQMDGLLVGGASLKPKEFIGIVDSVGL